MICHIFIHYQGFRQECLSGGSKVVGDLGVIPQEKKNIFLNFSVQNGPFELKWQQNMEYIFILFAYKGGGGDNPKL